MGKQTGNTKYAISPKELEAMLSNAAKMGAQEGVRAFMEAAENQRHQRSKDYVRATKTLIKKYRSFREMADKSICDVVAAEESCDDADFSEVVSQLMEYGVNKRELEIVSNKKRVSRTKTMLQHVDIMLEAYRLRCEKAENQDERRRYRVIHALYISDHPVSVSDLAEAEHIGITTLYDTVNKAVQDLAVLIFGVDGVRIQFDRNYTEKRPN